MPKIRYKSTNKAQWSSETLSKAEVLISQGQSMRSAAKAMNIPFSSLQKRLKKNNSSEPRLGRLPVFTADVEKVLSDRIKYLSSIFYGVTAIQIRKAAYQYAEELKISHNFDKSAKMAGRDWLDGFLKRNGISVRKPEATSVNRITAFNKEEVQLFYRLLGDLMDKYKFTPNNIYNCDETGISTVQDPGKILAPKGMKRVGSITSWERGKNITLLCAMSAAGGFVPPMFIFPRKRMTPQLEKDGPAGAIYKCSDNGWINEHLFFEWLQHFAMYTKPSSQAPVLLILDNHASHTSLMIYDFCKQNNIHMLSLPPHTSHRMQPLDLTFFGPLKAVYKKECDLFLKNRLAEKITPYDVAAILNRAYSTVASINKGESGFRASGIVPYNPNIFSEEDFTAAEVLTQSEVIIQDTSIVIPSTSAPTDPIPSTSSATIHPMPCNSSITTNLTPSTSSAEIHHMPSISSIAVDSIPSTSSVTLAPGILNSNIEDLLPLPIKMIPEKPIRKGRTKQHAKIMTSTPVKDSLVEKENKKASRAAKGKNLMPKASKKQKPNKDIANKAKRRVLQDLNTSSESDITLNQICDDDEDNDLNKCLVCDEFGRNNELWYRCTSCGLWAHASCTGWDSPKGYVCDNC